MLTADLVIARRRGDELRLVTMDDEGRTRAHAIAVDLLETTEAHVGHTREELEEALGAIEVGPREYRLRDGLSKLIEDRCVIDANPELDPEEIRRDVFTRASAARWSLGPEPFDRHAVLAAVAHDRETTEEAVEHALFADLRGAHVLSTFDALSAEALVAAYERAQAQAVLLRAVKVTVDVRSASPGALRAFFRRLKFLRLLHAIERTKNGYRIVIDGPFSLFESITKYGLQLAMLLPALEDCDAWRLQAEVRWGKERTPLSFRLAKTRGTEGEEAKEVDEPRLPDEVDALVRSFEALETEWRVSPNTEILELPGVGLTIPDLVFERGGRRKGKATKVGKSGKSSKGSKSERVYLEVMGYWSRAAVWKRVELVQAGLAERVLFAVSSRLRVSEEVLEDDLPGALYVYKGTMSARAVAERVERLAGNRPFPLGTAEP